jgi:rhomboid family GlyGly-CTERM serine protease
VGGGVSPRGSAVNWRGPGVAWAAFGLSLALASLVVASLGLDPHAGAWSRAQLGVEPWRWITGAWVHWTPAHAAANIAGALVLAGVGWRAGLSAQAAGAWALALPLAQLGLGLKPDLQVVAGLSGFLHAGVAVLVTHLVLQASGRDRWVGVALGLGLLVKLGLEQPWGPALRAEAMWGAMPIVPWAHLAGVVAGLLAFALVAAWRRWARR